MAKKSKTTPPVNRKQSMWLGFAEKQRNQEGRLVIRPRFGRIGAALVLLACLGYLGLVTLAYGHFRFRRGYEEASFVKLLAFPAHFVYKPARVPFDREMGAFLVEEGKDALEEGEFMRAFSNIRSGVQRDPDNIEGRVLLAEFLLHAYRMPQQAADILEEGLEYQEELDVDYIRGLLSLLLNQQMDERLLRLAGEILPEQPQPGDELMSIVAFAAAQANYFRGNYDQAEDLLDQYQLLENITGTLLDANISWERGQPTIAIEKLENALTRFPGNERLFMEISRFYREMDDYQRSRRYAVRRNVANPLSPAPRVELLFALEASGEEERLENELSNYLGQFSDEAPAMRLLANYAAEVGNVNLAQRVYEIAVEEEFPLGTFALLLVEAHIVADDYAGAVETVEELADEEPAWLAESKAIFASLRAIAHLGVGADEVADLHLQEFLNESGMRVETMLAVSRRLVDLEAFQQADRVLSQAYGTNPSNQAALSELIRLEMLTGSTARLSDLLSDLLEMRRPDYDLVVNAYETLGSDRFLFAPNREEILVELNSILESRGALAAQDA